MRRRSAVLAVAATPLSLRAQAPARAKPALVAVLALGSPETSSGAIDTVKARLAELGWVEGQSVRYEVRYAHLQVERLAELARDIVALQPDVIWTSTTTTAVAVRDATATVPIVFAGVGDPVGVGLARSLARPGGNATGLSTQMVEFGSKSLQLLQRLLPRLGRVGFVGNLGDPAARLLLGQLNGAAPALKLVILVADVRRPDALEAGFEQLAQGRVEAVVVSGDLLTVLLNGRIGEQLVHRRWPAIVSTRGLLGQGAVLSYGSANAGTPQSRRSADYIDRLLRGARPADLPIEQPTRFNTVLDRRAARAIGLEAPREFLLLADEVIE